MNDHPKWLKPIACLVCIETGARAWILEVDEDGVWCYWAETRCLDYLNTSEYGDWRLDSTAIPFSEMCSLLTHLFATPR